MRVRLTPPLPEGNTLQQSVPDQCRQPMHMFAVSVCQKSHAVTRTISGIADAHVIEIGQTQTMHSEAAAADFTGNFLEDVVVRAAIFGDAQKTDAQKGSGGGCVRGLLQYSAGKRHPYLFHRTIRFGPLLMKPGLLRRSLFPVVGRQRHSPKCCVAQQVRSRRGADSQDPI